MYTHMYGIILFKDGDNDILRLILVLVLKYEYQGNTIKWIKKLTKTSIIKYYTQIYGC